MNLSTKILSFRAKNTKNTKNTGRDFTDFANVKAIKLHDKTAMKFSHQVGQRKTMVITVTMILSIVLGLMLFSQAVHHKLLLSNNSIDEVKASIVEDSIRETATSRDKTLLLYTYSNSNPEYERNLHYFVLHGVSDEDWCDYFILVQEGEGILPSKKPLPPLPSNARYVYHENLCYDWGTFGWALNLTQLTLTKYQYIVFMNSSVRGPHLPLYWPADVHWSTTLTSRLKGNVKLVGSTISCESTCLHGDATAIRRQNPHVQSYIMATDQVGLRVLQEDGLVFKCYESLHDTVWNSELGAAAAIFQAGYTIDSLMMKYKGVNWTNKDNWNCNAGLNPYKVDMYDGVNLTPLEVMFVKVKDYMLQANWAASKTSQAYDRWSSHEGASIMVRHNEYADNVDAFRYPRVYNMLIKGPGCFDFDHYKRVNALPFEDSRSLWDHFVKYGQFDGQGFKFECWQDGTSSSPVDGQWYDLDAQSTNAVTVTE